jgi:hypothetical protein
MSEYLDRLDECFDLEQTVLREMNIIPAGELNRILNQTDLKKTINVSDKGIIGDSWETFFSAMKKKNISQVKKSLAKLIMGYGVMIQFLGQPKNKRSHFLKTFLRSTQGSPGKK